MTVQAVETEASVKLPRIGLLDTMRGLALIAMATYHFSWDLEFVGYLAPGTAESGWLKLYARAIATAFLFIVGFSLFLASKPEIRWPSYWRRLGMIVAAAAVISIATRYFTPNEWIYFGILHCIAVLSLIGLIFLRLPLAVTAAVTLALLGVWAADTFTAFSIPRSAILNPRYLAWIGFAEAPQRSNDYVPIFPWIVPFLLGLTAAMIAARTSLLHTLALFGTGSPLLAKAGRHSLAFYLIHQPVLISIAYGLSIVAPPAKPVPAETYLNQCRSSCMMQEGEALCRSFCQCTLEKLQSQNLFATFQAGGIKPDDERIQTLAGECSAAAQ
jgi:uncharacterized membrane protein